MFILCLSCEVHSSLELSIFTLDSNVLCVIYTTYHYNYYDFTISMSSLLTKLNFFLFPQDNVVKIVYFYFRRT